MFKRLRDFLALSMGISTPGAEPNELKWARLNQEREAAQKVAETRTPAAEELLSGAQTPTPPKRSG